VYDYATYIIKSIKITYLCVYACASLSVPGRVVVCMCVLACSLNYPAYNSYAPYCKVIRDPSGSTIIFRYYLIKGTIFEKRNIEHKMFVFYLQCLSKTFLILRRIQRYIVINLKTSSCKVPVILFVF
jgi:hypothetical protein